MTGVVLAQLLLLLVGAAVLAEAVAQHVRGNRGAWKYALASSCVFFTVTISGLVR